MTTATKEKENVDDLLSDLTMTNWRCRERAMLNDGDAFDGALVARLLA
jgi:hypothetical protein